MTPAAWGMLVLALALAWYGFRHRFSKTPSLTHIEYWVYLSQDKLPPIEKVMDRMISANPYNRKGRPCIGAREGMLFTDIRLHVGLAKIEKNPHLFRPDLESPAAEPSREVLEALATSRCLARVSYVSEKPLPDTRHLQFVPHYAGAICDLADGVLVFDRISEEFWLPHELETRMQSLPTWERIDAHCRVVELPLEVGVSIQTRGLRKIGLPELVSLPVKQDERQTARMVMEESLGRIWKKGELQDEWSVIVMETSFELSVVSRSLKEAQVRIAREVPA